MTGVWGGVLDEDDQMSVTLLDVVAGATGTLLDPLGGVMDCSVDAGWVILPHFGVGVWTHVGSRVSPHFGCVVWVHVGWGVSPHFDWVVWPHAGCEVVGLGVLVPHVVLGGVSVGVLVSHVVLAVGIGVDVAAVVVGMGVVFIGGMCPLAGRAPYGWGWTEPEVAGMTGVVLDVVAGASGTLCDQGGGVMD